MASINKRVTKNGRTRYRVLVRRAGHPCYSQTFDRKREAQRWAKQIEAELASGLPITGQYTVAALIDRALGTLPDTRHGRQKAQQLRVWRLLVGEITLEHLAPRHLSEARDKLLTTRGPATVVRYLASLSSVLQLAIRDWQWIDKNPCKQIIWPTEPRGRVRFLDDKERHALFKVLGKAQFSDLKSIVLIALNTGMRRGEIVNLRWRDVDMDRRRIILTETKNGERRQVPLTKKAWFCLAMRLSDAGRVFCSVNGQQVGRLWRAAVKEADINDFRFHDLRHTAASYLAMTGATTHEIAEILGHKTLNMVKRYAHLTTSHSAKVLDRMSAEYFK